MEKMTLEDETKTIIKLKIDNLEQLEKGELNLLMSMISNLYQNIQKEKNTSD